ncbi:HEAT repeat domain-containing protein [Calothrix sp. 336/3]|uniref:HEAT repeat domain-containing protein n=1 Tax=Calothrix sp. 336/3 TaxID=1337936 RepID=UPI0004E2DA6D|nr:HEAT repeat domain-containing protein [Calothrix sp. 336/3]AKG22958.1 PBS lyase [Calothrix sp. 336/3]
MKNINQVLSQAQLAYDNENWSLLITCLQQLIIEDSLQNSTLRNYQEELLKLAIASLQVGDFQERWEISKILNRLGAIAIPPLLEILQNQEAEEELRWYCIRILSNFQDETIIPALVELLQNNHHEELQLMAATALGKMGEKAVNTLSQLLAADKTKIFAVRILGTIPHPAIIDSLLTVVNDTEISVRRMAIAALSSFHDPRIPPVLLTALDDVAAAVRKEAVLGLGFRPDLQTELQLVGKLRQRLEDNNLDVCCAAVVALSRMGGDVVPPYLSQVLMSSTANTKLQIEVIRALSWMENQLGLELLNQAFHNLQSEILWQEIVTVLGRISHPNLKTTATQMLLKILDSQHPALGISAIKRQIALSLGQLGKTEALEPLINLLADSDIFLRLHAIAALKNLAPEIAQAKLQEMSSNPQLPPDLQQGISTALAEW